LKPGEIAVNALPHENDDHHLERDHSWGKNEETLEIEKLPKAATRASNDIWGEPKHTKEFI